MTKIYYVQDLDFFEAPGGAEQTDRVYFKEGLKRGHDLNLITPHSPLGVEKDDLVILSNIRAYERSKILGIPCRTVTFTHDTWCLLPESVLYVDYVPKYISEVTPMTKVMGEHGLTTVKASMFREYSGTIYKIKPRGIPAISATTEHPILVIPHKEVIFIKQRNKYVQHTRPRLGIGGTVMQLEISESLAVFRQVKDIRKGDYVIFPRVQDSIPYRIQFGGWKDKIYITDFDDEMAEVLGWYVAEGSSNMENGMIQFSMNNKEEDYAKRIVDVLRGKLGLSSEIIIKDNSLVIKCQCRPFARWLRENFGTSARTKVLPSWLIKAPKRELGVFLKSYVLGDGYFDREKGMFAMSTASNRLMYSLLLAFAKIGILPNVSTIKEKISFINGKFYHTRKQYTLGVYGKQVEFLGLHYPKGSWKPKYMMTEFSFLIPVTKIETEEYTGPVFNIETDTNSYAAPIITHNCAYRLYLPLTEKCFTDCPEYPFWNEVYKKAELNIFLSPLHYDIHKERFGESVEPHFLTPSGFDDVDRFVDMKNGRSGTTCNLNGLLGFKGREQLFKYAGEHPEVAIDIGGSNMEGDKRLDVDLPPNIRYVGPIQSSELPKFYNKYEFYIELHDRPQPFNRTIVESYLSGCKLIVNSLVGATSWPWFTDRDSVRAHLKSAPSEFWVKLEKELNL